MSSELVSLLIVNVVGFLTMIVATIATSIKASSERKLTAETLLAQQKADAETLMLQQKAQRDEWLMKAQKDDERAERERKWAIEDRANAAANNRQMTTRLDSVARKTDNADRKASAALAATNLGDNLVDDPEPPPPPSRRVRAGTAADRRPEPAAEIADFDFGAAAELFKPTKK